MDTNWNLKNEIPQEQFITTIIDGTKSLSIVCPNLTPNICIGESNVGDFCAICNKEPNVILDVFPAQLDKEEFLHVKELLKKVSPDISESDLDIITTAISIDYINYHRNFKNKQEIKDKFAVYDSIFQTTDTDGDIIIIKGNAEDVVIKYDTAKNIMDEMVGKRFKSDVA